MSNLLRMDGQKARGKLSEYAAAELPFGPGRSLYFRARLMQWNDTKLRVTFYYSHYHSRILADDVRLKVPNEMEKYSREFHGCLTASALILDQTMKQHLRYEHEQDVIVAPKQIAAHLARAYNVEVNDMMRQWPAVRPFLLTEGVDVPDDIETAVRNLALKGEADVRREGM